ncbi:hypothetical protein V8F20_002802 [Naviculisporaceae sp. PSN 640]
MSEPFPNDYYQRLNENGSNDLNQYTLSPVTSDQMPPQQPFVFYGPPYGPPDNQLFIAKHEDEPTNATRYECQLCHKYKGDKAFKRRDHLLQHLKRTHKVEVDCLHLFASAGFSPSISGPTVQPTFQTGAADADLYVANSPMTNLLTSDDTFIAGHF